MVVISILQMLMGSPNMADLQHQMWRASCTLCWIPKLAKATNQNTHAFAARRELVNWLTTSRGEQAEAQMRPIWSPEVNMAHILRLAIMVVYLVLIVPSPTRKNLRACERPKLVRSYRKDRQIRQSDSWLPLELAVVRLILELMEHHEI